MARMGGRRLWGVRGRSHRSAWTGRGNRGVRLPLTNDRELIIGSDHPERLAERISTLVSVRREARINLGDTGAPGGSESPRVSGPDA